MEINEAIEISIAENRLVTFESDVGEEEIRDAVIDQKGCAIMNPYKGSKQITVWPPSQCTVLQNQGLIEVLPTCLV